MDGPDPKPGDIGCTQIKGDVGWLIRLGQFLNKVTWRFWTWRTLWRLAHSEHVFVYAGFGRVVEAEPGGARLGQLGAYPPDTIVWLRCPDEHRDAVVAAARSLLGTPYSFADYVALAARRLGISARRLRAYIESSRSMICSQLADRSAQLAGWNLFDDGRWAGDVTPLDIRELIRSQVGRAA